MGWAWGRGCPPAGSGPPGPIVSSCPGPSSTPPAWGGEQLHSPTARLQPHFDYDDLNRMIAKKLDGATLVTYEYDDVGNLTKLTDPGGNVVYHYDTVNNMDWMDEPGGQRTTFTYNENNERKTIAYPTGGWPPP